VQRVPYAGDRVVQADCDGVRGAGGGIKKPLSGQGYGYPIKTFSIGMSTL
jgi:hypothetical protein